jgi:hypothetical protein
MRCPCCDHDNRAERRFCARWSKEFLEAGKKRLLGDTTREATAPEVKTLREENARLKAVGDGDGFAYASARAPGKVWANGNM